VREIEERTRGELLQRVQSEGATLKLIADTDEDQKMAKGAALPAMAEHHERLRTRLRRALVIHIGPISRRANTPGDIELRAATCWVISQEAELCDGEGAGLPSDSYCVSSRQRALDGICTSGGPTKWLIGSNLRDSGGWFRWTVDRAAGQRRRRETAATRETCWSFRKRLYSGTTR